MKTFVLCLLVVGAFASPARRPLFRRGYPQIVGGSDASPGEFPYQLSFQDTSFGMKFHFCGASIYDSINTITAAHCVEGEDYDNPRHLQVVAGEHDLSKVSGDEQEIPVVKIAIHEDFRMYNMFNDIAILKGGKSFVFNDKVAPIKLPNKGQQTTGECTVTGWGTLYSGGPTPDVLQKVNVNIVSDDDCKGAYGSRRIRDSNLCAGASGKDSCQGDSGGPLKCGDYLGGVVSWGYGCADAKYPGVYTEVSYFIDWINENSF